jgi:predicted transcriptional regulator
MKIKIELDDKLHGLIQEVAARRGETVSEIVAESLKRTLAYAEFTLSFLKNNER